MEAHLLHPFPNLRFTQMSKVGTGCVIAPARIYVGGQRVTAVPTASVPSMFDSSKVKVLFTT